MVVVVDFAVVLVWRVRRREGDFQRDRQIEVKGHVVVGPEAIWIGVVDACCEVVSRLGQMFAVHSAGEAGIDRQ